MNCRICLDDDGELIQPCNCLSSRVHRNCLDQWRAENKDGLNFSQCEVCRFVYEMEPAPTVSFASVEIRNQWINYVGRIVWILTKDVGIVVGGIGFWALICFALDWRHARLPALMQISEPKAYLVCGVVLFLLCLDIYGLYLGYLTDDSLLNNSSRRRSTNSDDCCCLWYGGSEASGLLLILCLIVVVVSGLVIGIMLVGQELIQDYANHYRILQNFRQIQPQMQIVNQEEFNMV